MDKLTTKEVSDIFDGIVKIEKPIDPTKKREIKMANLYYTTVSMETAARVLMTICRRDKVYLAEADRMMRYIGTPNSGIVGETLSGCKIGIFTSTSDRKMLLIINDEMYQSRKFYSEVFGIWDKTVFKPFDLFNILMAECIIDNGDWVANNTLQNTYPEACMRLELMPIDYEKEIDDLVAKIHLPVVKIGDKEMPFDTILIRNCIGMVPSIPNSPKWRLTIAKSIVKKEWKGRVADAADLAVDIAFSTKYEGPNPAWLTEKIENR